MEIQLEKVTRENWEEAISLRVAEEQAGFTPPVAVSLAKIYVKPDGDNVDYIPFAIYDGPRMVGFMMHACEENTVDSYWINGFLIDERYQGRGFGRAALMEMIRWIVNRRDRCREIRLTVHGDNSVAKRLYESAGFKPTGTVYGEEEVWRLPVR
ncbi:N-acetyltransferase [Paenibacillus sp. XY044]|uniref:GNAT family N-acetyltransferase n=1 Tax=Paenibacillus sp. XY044 TaxID=2026089 RepID=UPI000B997925|nr:GNAT family N-acetyltransferase [Paenibacillus sp. XY044]OZB96688.1 GNAT family N-acetyltransferase [Paenibacillus sp. XY044]